MTTYEHLGPPLNPFTREKFRRLVADDPGRTADELAERLRVHDRMILRPALRILVGRLDLRRDNHGRYWPA